MNFSRKSQAAMEFLMTYGWAILVVLVAIGALAYFGVLSPDKFLPSKCTLPSGLACLDHKATDAGITVVLQNALGYDIDSVTVDFVSCGRATVGAASLANGAKDTYTAACDLSALSKYSGDVTVNYRVIETELTHNKT